MGLLRNIVYGIALQEILRKSILKSFKINIMDFRLIFIQIFEGFDFVEYFVFLGVSQYY